MKRLFTLFLSCAIAIIANAQTDAQKLQAVSDLIAKKQYLSAMETLKSIENGSPELVVLATDIVLDHSSATNTAFDRWTLKDITAGTATRTEDIELPLEEFLWNSASYLKNDCRVYRSLSRLYEKMFRFRDQYMDLGAMQSIAEEIEKALPSQCADYLSAYVLGFCKVGNNQTAAAISYLQKSIAANPAYAPAHLQLGMAYFSAKDYTNAMKHARKSFELETDRNARARAALLIGRNYEATNDNGAALVNYLLADSLSRKDFFIQQALLNLYVKTNNEKAPEMLNSFIGGQGRSTLHYYVDAWDIYRQHKREMDLAMFCQKDLPNRRDASDIQACLNFTLGLIYRNINSDMSNQYFRTARDKGLDPNWIKTTRNHPATAKLVEDVFRSLK